MCQKGANSMTRLSRYRQKNNKHKKNAVILAILMIILSVFDVLTSSTVNAASSHTTRINLSANQVKQNGNITLTADAIVNGSTVKNGYTYRFLYNTDGGKSAYPLGDYSSQNWYTFKPSEISNLKSYTGPVFIFADSKTGSTSVWSSYKILNIIPNDEESLKATGTVTSAGNYTVGDPLIITMTASGGKAPYTYKYEYCQSGNNYSTYKNYTETSSVTIPTSSWTANTDYNVKVTVKDNDGKTFSYISAVRLSAKPVPDPAISSFTVQSTAKIGEKVRLSCIASSGTTPYKYKFTYTTPSGSEKIIKEKINKMTEGKTSYHNLKFCERNRKAEIKVSSSDAYKIYKALVKCDKPYDKDTLDSLNNLDEIHQQTPLRVLHRRADKVRIKHVHNVSCEIIDDTTFEMTVKTEGGLYIKELISGDEDRTKPNVGEVLGVKSICEQLDVVEVSEK